MVLRVFERRIWVKNLRIWGFWVFFCIKGLDGFGFRGVLRGCGEMKILGICNMGDY